MFHSKTFLLNLLNTGPSVLLFFELADYFTLVLLSFVYPKIISNIYAEEVYGFVTFLTWPLLFFTLKI